jgi:16S rRNA (cytosine967-C5)-methyltransferase
MRLPRESLAFAMNTAAIAVDRVRAGQSLPQALDAVFHQAQLTASAQAGIRGAVQDIAYRTMRGLGKAQAVLRELVARPPAPRVDALLTVALALLLEESPAYTEFTIVDQAVRAAAADPRTAQARGMVNAVLRRLQRERVSLDAVLAEDDTARWNYPAWWVQAVRDAWPDDWQRILRVGNTHPPLTLRVDIARVSVADYLQQLDSHELNARQIGPQAVRLEHPVPVTRIPGFAEGIVSVQDAGAQRAARLLDLHAGQRVLDACAAPGGKSGHILELAPVSLISLDSDSTRLRRVNENLERLGRQATVLAGDAGHPASWWDGQPFDRILADVPCSASGIVRRHPDIRWLRRPDDVAQLQAVQRRIVSALWTTLAPGGKLLYVTCSIFPTEGEGQAQWFETHLEDAIRLQAPGQMLPQCDMSSDHRAAEPNGEWADDLTGDHDGFYYALFQKRC